MPAKYSGRLQKAPHLRSLSRSPLCCEGIAHDGGTEAVERGGQQKEKSRSRNNRFKSQNSRNIDSVGILISAHFHCLFSQGKKYMRRADLEALEMRGGCESGKGGASGEVGEGGSGVVVSPTTPTPKTPGDDNPVFTTPRVEVSDIS